MKEPAYVNGYLHIHFRRTGESGNPRLLYCAGVNIRRFRPLTWGTHGQFMNPAFRGLQLLRLKFLIPSVQEAGGKVRRVTNADCGEVPSGDGWFRESFELDGLPEDYPVQVLLPCVRYLVQAVLKVARPGTPVPLQMEDPVQLERQLDELAEACVQRP